MSRKLSRPEPIRLPTHSSHCSPPCSPRGCPAAVHKPQSPSPPFRLLDLPPEVVNHIASLAVVSPTSIVIHEPRFNRHPTPPPPARSRPRLDRKVLPTPPSSRGASPLSKTQEQSRERVLSPTRERNGGNADKRGRKRNKEISIGHTRLALLMSCRTLYRDQWSLYYAMNTFEFKSLYTFQRFMNALPSRCRNQITKVSLHMPRKHYHDKAWKLLADMKRLAEIEVWLRPADTMASADVGEWEACDGGARRCKALKMVIIRRESDDENEDEDEANADAAANEPEEVQQAAVLPSVDAAPGEEVTGNQGDDATEEQEEEEETSGLEQVLKKDREIEGKVNTWLKEREDSYDKYRQKLNTKPKCGNEVFPADESEGEF